MLTKQDLIQVEKLFDRKLNGFAVIINSAFIAEREITAKQFGQLEMRLGDRISKVENRLHRVEIRLDHVEDRLDALLHRNLANLDERVEFLESKTGFKKPR